MTLLAELFALAELKTDADEDVQLDESAGDTMRRDAMKLKRDGNIESHHRAMMKYHQHMQDSEHSNLDRHGRLSLSGKLALKNIEKHKKGYANHKQMLADLKVKPPGAVEEAFGIKIDGELWMKGDKPVTFASKEEADAAILKSPSMSPKNARVVPLNESPELQALGKGFKSTKPVVVADDDALEVSTDTKKEPSTEPEADPEEPKASTFKVGDKVKPVVGPHKDVVHSVIHVFPDGRINLKPDGLKADQVKYRLGAVTAQPAQVVLAEARITTGSMLKQFSLMEAGPDKSGMMPMSYGAKKGHKIEAYGRKGLKNTMWRKMFKDFDALNKWAEDNDATIEGTRELDDAEKVQEGWKANVAAVALAGATVAGVVASPKATVDGQTYDLAIGTVPKNAKSVVGKVNGKTVKLKVWHATGPKQQSTAVYKIDSE